MRHHDVWLEDKDYPDEKDIEEFGYDSPPDYDPLTIGYIGDNRPPLWSTRRVVFLIFTLLIVSALFLPFFLRLF
ncbi:MAG: hypothetical protein AAF846_19725 [Chloroflexota bacterium]